MKKNAPPISFAIEKGFRIMQHEVQFFHFFMVQFALEKSDIATGDYVFALHELDNSMVYQRKIHIDLENHCIVTPGSHEDPLVESEGHYLVCFQIDSEILKTIDHETMVKFSQAGKLIQQARVGSLAQVYSRYHNRHYSRIEHDSCITTTKDCTLTLHLGDNQARYTEQSFALSSGESFDFSSYIGQYSYIGVQCSYEDEFPEIEEKHIVVGQKGIYLSGAFFNQGQTIMPPLNFKRTYQQTLADNAMTRVASVQELLDHYAHHGTKPRTFESNRLFLLPGYLMHATYNQDGLYASHPPGKNHHQQLAVCQECAKACECLQVLPSGLSSEMFKRNLALDDCKDCVIFQLIE